MLLIQRFTDLVFNFFLFQSNINSNTTCMPSLNTGCSPDHHTKRKYDIERKYDNGGTDHHCRSNRSHGCHDRPDNREFWRWSQGMDLRCHSSWCSDPDCNHNYHHNMCQKEMSVSTNSTYPSGKLLIFILNWMQFELCFKNEGCIEFCLLWWWCSW